MKPRLIAISGSLRAESFNQKLARHAADLARRAGAEVTLLSLRDFDLPLMDEDLERDQGLPENAAKLKRLFREHHGFILACPEYNSSITPPLKNMIDWLSRPYQDEPPLAAFVGKVVGLCSASPGMLGGLRGLYHVREILGNIQALVVPSLVAVSKADQAFDEQGQLRDERQRKLLDGMVGQVVRTAAALHRE